MRVHEARTSELPRLNLGDVNSRLDALRDAGIIRMRSLSKTAKHQVTSSDFVDANLVSVVESDYRLREFEIRGSLQFPNDVHDLLGYVVEVEACADWNASTAAMQALHASELATVTVQVETGAELPPDVSEWLAKLVHEPKRIYATKYVGSVLGLCDIPEIPEEAWGEKVRNRANAKFSQRFFDEGYYPDADGVRVNRDGLQIGEIAEPVELPRHEPF